MNNIELNKFITEYGMDEMYQANYVFIRTLVYGVLTICLFALSYPLIILFLEWW